MKTAKIPVKIISDLSIASKLNITIVRSNISMHDGMFHDISYARRAKMELGTLISDRQEANYLNHC